VIIINIIELKPEEANILYINKKCEKCGHIYTYEEIFRMENKYAVLHIMFSICSHEELIKYKIEREVIL
jgi:hypothetical protein